MSAATLLDSNLSPAPDVANELSELKKLLAQRTAELTAANELLRTETKERVQAERHLRHAQKMEAVGQLAAGVAHDFNNILTIIHGHGSMLSLQLGKDTPYSRSVAEICSSAQRAANLVRQLLAFSRKQVIQFREVQLHDTVVSVSSMLRQLIGENISLDTTRDEQLPPIRADRSMIEQVVLNLTLNARDAIASRDGRISLHCSLEQVSAERAARYEDGTPGNFVCLSVTDNGCGITPEVRAHLFEPFFTTKEVGQGIGLGLATVYGIARQHGAWIEVESDAGRGSVFRVLFPIADLARASEVAAPATATKETIVIAEDEAAVRELVRDVLLFHGYRVIAAKSGPEAMALCRESGAEIHLLLTDMVMPGGMMGPDLAVELQNINPKLKVIYTTGYNPGMKRFAAQLEEGVNFLPKPYPTDKLLEILRQALA
jgi:two-component system cell cycle sensor histidine kinase/response regulator CckA